MLPSRCLLDSAGDEFSGDFSGRAPATIRTAAAMATAALARAQGWWDDVNNSRVWQEQIFHALAGLFGFVAAVALVRNLVPRRWKELIVCCCLWKLDLWMERKSWTWGGVIVCWVRCMMGFDVGEEGR